MFWFSNIRPNTIANTPNTSTVMRDAHSSCEVASPFADYQKHTIMAYTADAPDKVRPATTAKILAKATAGNKAQEQIAAQSFGKVDCRHTGAADDLHHGFAFFHHGLEEMRIVLRYINMISREAEYKRENEK